jgi:hypothetical protein
VSLFVARDSQSVMIICLNNINLLIFVVETEFFVFEVATDLMDSCLIYTNFSVHVVKTPLMLFLKTLNLCSSLRLTDHVSYPC